MSRIVAIGKSTPIETGVRYKPDAALEEAKQREMARLTRIHYEKTLATPRKVADGFDASMFEELPNMKGDQTLLF